MTMGLSLVFQSVCLSDWRRFCWWRRVDRCLNRAKIMNYIYLFCTRTRQHEACRGAVRRGKRRFPLKWGMQRAHSKLVNIRSGSAGFLCLRKGFVFLPFSHSTSAHWKWIERVYWLYGTGRRRRGNVVYCWTDFNRSSLFHISHATPNILVQ